MSHLSRNKVFDGIKNGKPPLVENTPPLDSKEFARLLQPDSYDLRTGLVIADGRPMVPDHGREYLLPPGEMAIILTKETINVPASMAAEVSSSNALLSDGLLVITPAHVDPGYQGLLTARVINLRNKNYRLSEDFHILTIRFYSLDSETTPYDNNVSRDEKISRSIRESRDTLHKFFIDENDLVLKKELRSAAFIEALTWLSLLIPAIVAVIPFTIPVFWELGRTISTTKPELYQIVLQVLILFLGPVVIIGYVVFWSWVVRLVMRKSR